MILPTYNEAERLPNSLDATAGFLEAQQWTSRIVVVDNGGYTVERAIESDSSLESRLQETIRGAEILKSEFTTDNGCVVTLRLPKSRLQKMMGVRFQ